MNQPPVSVQPLEDLPEPRPELSSYRIIEMIQIRLAKWIGLGILLFILWGKSNDWPRELIFSTVLLPLALLFTQRHYIRHHFARTIPADIPVWDFMISCLLLTTGVASGKLTLISIGWVAMGVVFLKPVRTDLNWAEWFKIPMLWLVLFPVWLDFKYNSINFCDFLVGNPLALPNSEGPGSWDYTRFHFGILTSFIVLAGGLRGSLFWKCLPLIPAVAFSYSWLQNQLPPVRLPLIPLQLFMSWLLTPGTIALLVWVINRTVGVNHLHKIGPSTEFIRRSRFSGFFLWLSFAVISMQQFNLIKDTFFMEGTLPLNTVAATLWLGGMLWLRFKTDESSVDTRTRILLTLALVSLITGEWTDVNFLRHISLGLGIMTLVSWKRVWPTQLLCVILFTWILMIPAGQVATTKAIQGGFGNPFILGLALLACLIFMVVFGLRNRQEVRILNSGDYEWLPSMRFSFLILILLVSFQFLSGFGTMGMGSMIKVEAQRPDLLDSEQSPVKGLQREQTVIGTMPGLNRVKFYTVNSEDGNSYRLVAAEPVQQSCGLPSPVLILRELGYRTTHQRLLYSSKGSAMQVRISSLDGKTTGTALLWWKNIDRTFFSHQKAQRILWSSWFHAERDISLYILMHDSDIIETLPGLASSYNWFFLDPEPVPQKAPATRNDESAFSAAPIPLRETEANPL